MLDVGSWGFLLLLCWFPFRDGDGGLLWRPDRMHFFLKGRKRGDLIVHDIYPTAAFQDAALLFTSGNPSNESPLSRCGVLNTFTRFRHFRDIVLFASKKLLLQGLWSLAFCKKQI